MRSISNSLAALAMLCFSSVNAAPISINFSGLATGTPVTNQFSGVQFSLIGGPGPIGAPTVINYGVSELTNSTYSGAYPTSNILNITFADVASGISFGFNPAGSSNCASGGRGATFYSAYDIADRLVESGALGCTTGGGYGLFSVASSGVHRLALDNGTNGSDSWWFGLRSLQADVTAASSVSEPSSYTMLVAGLLGFGFCFRQKINRRVS